MGFYQVVRTELRLTAEGWTGSLEAGQVLTVGKPESFSQAVADYLVAHDAITPIAGEPELVPTEEPAPEPEPEVAL